MQEEMEHGRFGSIEAVIVQAIHALHEKSLQEAPRQPKMPFGQFLLESPLRDSGLKLERLQDYPRPIDL